MIRWFIKYLRLKELLPANVLQWSVSHTIGPCRRYLNVAFKRNVCGAHSVLDTAECSATCFGVFGWPAPGLRLELYLIIAFHSDVFRRSRIELNWHSRRSSTNTMCIHKVTHSGAHTHTNPHTHTATLSPWESTTPATVANCENQSLASCECIHGQGAQNCSVECWL